MTRLALNDVCLNICDGVHNTVIDTPNEHYYLLSAKNIKDGCILVSSDERTISLETLEKLRRRTKLSKDDVVITTVGTIGEVALIPDNNINYEFQRSVGILKPDQKIINARFLKYVMQSSSMRTYLLNNATGAAQPCLFIGFLKKVKIEFPDISQQEKIASILSAYDDLIEKNNRKIAILQEIAEELYKEWFVRFRFPGYKTAKFKDGIPEGWNIKRLEEFGTIETGKTPSTEVSEYYGPDIPFVKTPDMHENMWTIETEEMLSTAGSNSQAKKLLPTNSIMVSCIGTGGVVSINAVPSHTNQQINSIILNDLNELEWLFFTCVSLKPTIVSYGSTGATMTNLSKGKFEKLKILYPGKLLVHKYHDKTKEIFFNIRNLMYLNKNLKIQRDLLLPRLMSGKLEVKA